ncbi:protein pellino-like [Stegodyphus dumicola]|uniref:protein pellino-like n=1 Tax=Stegodyphus dumicola TaxID=202533 RepID=UPI0015A97012|nr:protein pellino-like [Stegodyphus dumicola]
MFVRKVLDWLLPQSEDEDDFETESVEVTSYYEALKSPDKTAHADEEDIASLSSLDAKTSVLNFALVPDISPTEYDENNSGKQDKIETYSVEEIRTGEKGLLCLTYTENEETRPSELSLSISAINVSNAKENTQDSNTSFKNTSVVDISSVDDSEPSHLCKKAAEYACCNVLEEKKPTKDIYTQTEPRLDKRRFGLSRRSVIKCSAERECESLYNKKQRPYSVQAASSCDGYSFPLKEFTMRKNTYSGDTVYGELLVLGCNGAVPNHLVGHMESKFVLHKRLSANGLKEASSFISNQKYPNERSPVRHAISYSISENRYVVVEYSADKQTDMFQIGRYDKHPVDFRVLDINESDRARNGVSRFACRIVIKRYGNHEARVYAAAFDATGGIFLGENALLCGNEKTMDGFTTNGVLIMHPKEGFSSSGVWREVSVCGHIYAIVNCRFDGAKRSRILEESNVLKDGTLIDLCGVTLLWRTPEGLKSTPSTESLENFESNIQKSALECYFLSKLPDRKLKVGTAVKQAFIFLSCGHVVGLHFDEIPYNLESWSCPVCCCISPISKLEVGREPGFYIDRKSLTHAFRPCGHVVTDATVRYWSSIKIPDRRIIQDGLCPFCGKKLNYVSKYIELIFPTKEMLPLDSRLCLR